jgi:hypothetical protein
MSKSAKETTQPSASAEWNATHLGKAVRLKNNSARGWRYRLKALTYEAGNGGVTATLEAIVPSPRPGALEHFALDSIELV